MRRIKKSIVGIIDWFFYTVLSTKQKEFLAGLLSNKQKQKMKSVIKPGKKRAQMRHVEQVKFKLYNLGFIDKGLQQLQELCTQDNEPNIQRLASWELALWHANQYTEHDAKKCITYLSGAIKGMSDTYILRRAAILEAESLHTIGKVQEAKSVIEKALASEIHADLYLAMASLEQDMDKRIEWINKVYLLTNEETIALEDDANPRVAYNHLVVPNITNAHQVGNTRVTIIIPVYNAADVIHTSLTSIQKQTWTNLEILVVDDCSTDNTYDIVKEYAEKDARIRVLHTEENSGAYTARNTALKVATGDFVTINDADDWSHPNKIRTQAQHLIDNEKLMGNFSQQARAMNDLTFYRRGKPGQYIFPNMSSFMFRRMPVLEKLGFWDSVRFAGDSEFVKRVKIVFGEKSVPAIKGAPLSFQRQSADSLTGDSAFGFPGFFMGVRKEYAEAHAYFHETHPDKLKYDFPMIQRPFPIPEPMWPKREKKPTGKRHFDVVMASEFHLLGGTNMSNIEEIKAQQKMGLKTGLVQLNRYDVNPKRETNPNVRELLNGDTVQMLVYGEKVSCDVLIIRHPPILEEWQKYVPDIDAGCVRVIANQTPKKEYSATGETLYGLEEVDTRVKAYFHKKPVWHPIGPLIRDILYKEHSDELEKIHLAKDDWINIIDVKEWRCESRAQNNVIKIGRHARDQYVKWPISKEELIKVYPDDSAYEIHVLGGATVPAKLVGRLPNNWHVKEFGEIHPRDFLRDMDVFVYFTHPELIEAFGRVIFEAMAAGVPVIIPPNYEILFQEAAIYAEPEEVQEKIEMLMNDEAMYQSQVEKALAYVEKHFGYSKHASRLEECLHGS